MSGRPFIAANLLTVCLAAGVRPARWLVLLAFCACTCPADVYTLSPRGIGAVEAMLHGRDVLKEKIGINGGKGDLEVMVLPQTLAETWEALRRFMPADATIQGNSIVVQGGEGEGAFRYLFISMGKDDKTIAYRLQNSRAKREPEWPRQLPGVDGASVRQVTELPDRGGVYAEARMAGPPVSVLRRYGGSLQSEGWLPLAGDATSGVFTRKDRMVVLAAEPTDGGSQSILAVYERKVDGKVPGK